MENNREIKTGRWPRPSLRNLGLGLLVFIVIIVRCLFAPETVKQLGIPFLFIPYKIGLIKEVAPDDVWVIDSLSSLNIVNIRNPGRYVIYSNYINLLLTAVTATKKDVPNFIEITFKESGERMPVSFVTRGVRPFDNPNAEGRPLFTFEVKTAGLYEIQFIEDNISLRGDEVISVLPDYTTGNEGIILLAFLVPLIILSTPFIVIYSKKTWELFKKERAEKKEKWKRKKALWDIISENKKQKND
jgi:hypothetical protein